MITKKAALSFSKRLDKLANEVQSNPRKFNLTTKAAHAFCYQLDQTSDSIEKLADVIHRDQDEPYMEYFNVGVVEDDLTPAPTHMEYFKDDTQNEMSVPLEGGERLLGASRRRNAARRLFAEEDEVEVDVEEVLEEVEKEASRRRNAARRLFAEEDEVEVDVEEVEKEASRRNRRNRSAASNWHVFAAEVEEEIEAEEESEEKEARRTASRRYNAGRGRSRTASVRNSRSNRYW